MPFATPIVPMPRWSTPVGCTKLFLTIVILAFVAACAAIWGSYPAFSISLFTASLSLFTFGYYIVALSFRRAIYNKWLILSLETTLTLFWFVSLMLLVGWTGANEIARYYYNLSPYPSAYGTSIDLSGSNIHRRDTMFLSWSTSGLCKRQGLDVPRTMVRHHNINAHYAAQILAGIAAGLAGMIFILYGTTTAVFAMNFHKTTAESETRRPSPASQDEEAQIQTVPQTIPQDQPHPGSHPSPLRSNMTHMSTTNSSTNVTVVPASTPSSLTEPLRIEDLPKDFEPQPQKQTYYSTTEDISEAGIEPPAPVLRGMAPEKKVDVLESAELVNAVVAEGEVRKGSTTVKEDGRMEREI